MFLDTADLKNERVLRLITSTLGLGKTADIQTLSGINGHTCIVDYAWVVKFPTNELTQKKVGNRG